MAFFKQEHFVYNSEEVYREFPRDFVESRYIEEYLIRGGAYPRIRYGSEKYENAFRHTRETCAECMVKLGEFHVSGCDWEVCPKCSGQAIGCECTLNEDEDFQEILIDEP